MGAVDTELRLGRARAELACVRQVGDRDARLMAWGRLDAGGGTEIFLADAGDGTPRVPALRIGDQGRVQVVLRPAIEEEDPAWLRLALLGNVGAEQR